MQTRRAIIAGLVLVGSTLVAPAVASATDDDYNCPAGTTFEYKIDNLSGPTFTVPTPPAGWTILGVVIKAGTEHYLYSPVTPGQVLDVKADTGSDASHGHICKGQPQTTTTQPEETTTSTSPPTTSTTTPSSTTTVSLAPTTTTVSASTTTSPSTSLPESTTSAAPPSSSPPTQPPTLPPTGSSTDLLFVALTMVGLGAIAIRAARRS